MKAQNLSWDQNVIDYNPETALMHKEQGKVKFKAGKKALKFLNNDTKMIPYLQKDPRMCITLPTWLKLLDKKPAIVFTYRHPLEVALSLKHRNNLTIEHGLRLWIGYNMRALQNSADLCRVFSTNEAVFKNPLQEVSRIKNELTLKCHVINPPVNELSEDVVNEFVDPKLQHNSIERGKKGEKHGILLKDFGGNCVAREFDSDYDEGSSNRKAGIKMYLMAMKVYCDLKAGKAYLNDYEWPDLSPQSKKGEPIKSTRALSNSFRGREDRRQTSLPNLNRNFTNTMIVATYPSSDLRLTAIWSQLVCFTASVDRIVLSAPDEEWSREAMANFTHQMKEKLPPKIYEKISLQFYTNDRYDAGLWCDALALEEESVGAIAKENTNYLLINDSLMAIRQFDGLLNSLSERDDVSLVSLNYWNGTTNDGGNDYWLESVARAFSPHGIQIYSEKVCRNLNETIGTVCASMGRKKRKRCTVEYSEIAVARYYNRTNIRGLYPGMVPEHMMIDPATGKREKSYSWAGHKRFWKNALVEQMNFPAVKVSHGFMNSMTEDEQHKLYSCTAQARFPVDEIK